MNGRDQPVRRRHIRAFAVLLGILATTSGVLTACVGGGNGADKAGGQGEPITLTLGTPDSDGHPDTPLIEHFAQQVEAISGGRVRINIDYSAAGEATNFDQVTVGKVRDGELDLGWVGSRAWDTQGVLGFQALQAPFLITNYPLVDRVLTSPIPAAMLADLKQVGIVGLGLYPDELRHPVGLGKPLLSLADFRGARIRVPASHASDELIRALGAQPVHVNGPAMVRAIDNGDLRGLESSTGNAALTQGTPIVTANITFFPRPITLFADAQRFAALTDSQRQALRTAAQRTLDFALQRPPEAGSAAKLCALGGAVVVADKSAVAAVVRAGQSVYPELEQDAQTRSFIDQIRRMKDDIGPTAVPPAPCGTVSGGQPGKPPDGAYTAVATKQDALRNHWPDECALREGGAHLTLFLSGGRFRLTESCPGHPESEADNGSVEVTAAALRTTANNGITNTFAWRFDGTVLTLRWVKSTPPGPYTPRAPRFLYDHAWTAR